MFLHWDLHKHFRSKATNVLLLLGKVALNALTRTSFFCCRVTSALRPEESMTWPSSENIEDGNASSQLDSNHDNEVSENLQRNSNGDNNFVNGNHSVRLPMFQRGVLRTNCIDCLDRTNVAQYAYGLAALQHQLQALGVIDAEKIDLDDPLADELMGFYERMGDTLAHQYGGSAAHNKIFSERRGQWRAATQSQEFFRTLQRYYSNAYMDAEKQDAINIFLGHFQPQDGKPAVWELRSDDNFCCGRNRETYVDEDERSFFKRSFSDGNILQERGSSLSATNDKQGKFSNSTLPYRSQGGTKDLSDSSPEISTCESDISYSRYTTSMSRRQLFGDMQRDRCLEGDHTYYSEHGDAFNCSNFVGLDWLSSSGNSCEEEPFERSSVLTNSSGMSSENVVNGILGEATTSTSEYGSSIKERQATGTGLLFGNAEDSNVLEDYTDTFVQWVNCGEALCH
ncbi:hypothetical protein SLEP1_g16011 [Rubroshorea leprosula]|uniref:SAC domain-containing protein n=1 Tax=Rubroshorea leprosula TaxID=152421 RepID=A0AAV5IYH2_9ROSI|nr:hypothetical protein SLEP1_g16011 [Rubroshorea leprosula]